MTGSLWNLENVLSSAIPKFSSRILHSENINFLPWKDFFSFLLTHLWEKKKDVCKITDSRKKN